ncbi:MAG: ribosome maturation factor RimM [Terriglobia bacterium]
MEAADDLFVVAKVTGTHGLTGTVEAKELTDFPDRFKPGLHLLVKPAKAAAADHGTGPSQSKEKELVVVAVRRGGKRLFLDFRGVESREAAQRLKGSFLAVRESGAVKLPEGHYWQHDIVGLNVVTAAGEPIGVVERVQRTGANDVYSVVAEDGREYLVPAIRKVIKSVDLQHKTMTIEVLPGLFE